MSPEPSIQVLTWEAQNPGRRRGGKRSAEPLDQRLDLRCTPAEHLQIEKAAGRAGLSLSQYLRRCALGRRVLAERDEVLASEAIGALRKATGMVKQVFAGGADPAETKAALDAVVAAARRVAEKLDATP